MKTKEEYVRVFFLLFLGMILASWIMINYEFGAGTIYLVIGGVSFLLYKYSNTLLNGG
jgi:hypothetical protein